MARLSEQEWDALYRAFEAPISAWDCGQYCAPYNDGDPVCCTIQQVIPVLYHEEFTLLTGRSGLWHEFWPSDAYERRLVDETGPGQCLAACSGAQFCERENRALSCRAFPFFPYLTRRGEFIGLSYYWEYRDRCWVISNLPVVTDEFRTQCVAAFESLFAGMPEERETYRQFSATMRRSYAQRGWTIPLLQREGGWVMVTPADGTLTPWPVEQMPTFAPFDTA